MLMPGVRFARWFSASRVLHIASIPELTAYEAPVMAAVALIEMTAMDPMDAAADSEIEV